VVGSAGGVAGDLVGGAAGLVNAATGGLAEEALNLIDDTVLDGVDYITGGVINVDFDNGGLTAEVGIDNFLSVGAGISGDGVTATADAPGLGVDVGFTGEDGATLLLDENIPGFELPAGAQVGLGVSADGGAGIIASVPDLGITVDILGDYDADLTLEQIEALSGGGSARVAAPAADPTAGGAAPLEADAFQTMTAAAPAPEADQFVAAAQAPAAPEFEPDAQTAFVQELTQADTVADAADDLWEGLP